MTDFGLGDDVVKEEKLDKSLRWHGMSQDDQIYIPESTGKPRTNFVIVCCVRDNFDVIDGKEVLVVLKNRPAWQAGRFNLPGGGIEEGENAFDAARRELKEETGLEAYSVRKHGVMTDRHLTIYCMSAELCDRAYNELVPREGETEAPSWVPWDSLYRDSRLLPNLKVIIPMCMRKETMYWEIEDESNNLSGAKHSMKITVLNL